MLPPPTTTAISTPRVREALLLNERYKLHAGLDLSDGLAMDLRRLTQASGCGGEIFAQQIPVSATANRHCGTPSEALNHALGDGEDFELILTLPQDQTDQLLTERADLGLTQIGKVVGRTGLWKRARGKLQRLPPQGYVHGSSDPNSSNAPSS